MKKRKLKTSVKIVISLIIISLVAFLGYYVVSKTNLIDKIFKDKESNKTEEKIDDSSNSNSNSNEQPKVEEPKEKRMSLVMVGDALIHGAVYMDAYKNGKYDFTNMFTDIAPIISKYDLRYYNQESIIGGGKPQHYPRLNSPDAIGENLISIGFNLVSLANNHSFDQNEKGLQYSIKFWKSHSDKVHTAGSYSSFEEQAEIPIYEQNGIKYAFLSYTIPTNGLSAPKGKEYYVNVYSEKQVTEDVTKARNNGAEVVIVAMHWGVEYTHVPNEEQKTVAKFLSSIGVDLVIGAHPHVIQPIEYVGNTLVIYSLGNFISAQRILGLEKIIGLLVGTDIVVKDKKVTFENTNFELLYTYSTTSDTKFKVIPFSKLNNNILNNYQNINEKYRKIVDPTGAFNGNK